MSTPCIYREILKKGNASSARLFSICTCKEYKRLLNAEEYVKIRNPLVCEDCPHRTELEKLEKPFEEPVPVWRGAS